MQSPLDDLAFLANSQNRVAVLERLVESPQHRDELRAATDASRVTLSRILADLEDRHWIDRTGQECRATALGAWVSDAVGDLLETIAAQQQLQQILPWFPADAVEFDLRRLATATIHVPDHRNPVAHVEPVVTCFEEATSVSVLADQTTPRVLETVTNAVEAGQLQVDGVLTRTLLESVVADRTMEPLIRRLLAAPGADLVVTECTPLVVCFVADETVGFPVTDGNGLVRGLVLADEPVVREWAEETIDRYRADAVAIEPVLATG